MLSLTELIASDFRHLFIKSKKILVLCMKLTYCVIPMATHRGQWCSIYTWGSQLNRTLEEVTEQQQCVRVSSLHLTVFTQY